jgi:hypothetical protein
VPVAGLLSDTPTSQMGHTSPTVTLGLYAQAIRPEDPERLRALVEGVEVVPSGTKVDSEVSDSDAAAEVAAAVSGSIMRDSDDGRGGFRTCDLSRVKRALSH